MNRTFTSGHSEILKELQHTLHGVLLCEVQHCPPDDDLVLDTPVDRKLKSITRLTQKGFFTNLYVPQPHLEDEIVEALKSDIRLPLIVYGAPGTGKTSLVTFVLTKVRNHFCDLVETVEIGPELLMHSEGAYAIEHGLLSAIGAAIDRICARQGLSMRSIAKEYLSDPALINIGPLESPALAKAISSLRNEFSDTGATDLRPNALAKWAKEQFDKNSTVALSIIELLCESCVKTKLTLLASKRRNPNEATLLFLDNIEDLQSFEGLSSFFHAARALPNLLGKHAQIIIGMRPTTAAKNIEIKEDTGFTYDFPPNFTAVRFGYWHLDDMQTESEENTESSSSKTDSKSYLSLSYTKPEDQAKLLSSVKLLLENRFKLAGIIYKNNSTKRGVNFALDIWKAIATDLFTDKYSSQAILEMSNYHIREMFTLMSNFLGYLIKKWKGRMFDIFIEIEKRDALKQGVTGASGENYSIIASAFYEFLSFNGSATRLPSGERCTYDLVKIVSGNLDDRYKVFFELMFLNYLKIKTPTKRGLVNFSNSEDFTARFHLVGPIVDEIEDRFLKFIPRDIDPDQIYRIATRMGKAVEGSDLLESYRQTSHKSGLLKKDDMVMLLPRGAVLADSLGYRYHYLLGGLMRHKFIPRGINASSQKLIDIGTLDSDSRLAGLYMLAFVRELATIEIGFLAPIATSAVMGHFEGLAKYFSLYRIEDKLGRRIESLSLRSCRAVAGYLYRGGVQNHEIYMLADALKFELQREFRELSLGIDPRTNSTSSVYGQIIRLIEAESLAVD